MKHTIVLILLTWLALTSGCKTTHHMTKPGSGTMTYLALGDSYTIGESVEVSERYPNQLAAALREEGKSVSDPEIIARTGWTTADLQRGITAADIQAKQYDLVTLLIGVNNEFQQRSESEYTTEFRQLLLQAIAFANGKKEQVYVISIPDYGYTPYGEGRQSAISARIDRFNAINKQITDSLQIAYIDITPVSRKGLSDPSLVASDGLHPSGKQYAEWVKIILNMMA